MGLVSNTLTLKLLCSGLPIRCSRNPENYNNRFGHNDKVSDPGNCQSFSEGIICIAAAGRVILHPRYLALCDQLV